MPWLIVFDPEFWLGVATAAWALFGGLILEISLLVVLVAVMLWLIYKSIVAKGKRK